MLKFGFPDIYNLLLLLKLGKHRIIYVYIYIGNNEIYLYLIHLISLTINIGNESDKTQSIY
jgi:hypothetical protein